MPAGILPPWRFFQKIFANFLDPLPAGLVKSPWRSANQWLSNRRFPSPCVSFPDDYPMRWHRGKDQSAPRLLHQFFRDLHGVQRGAFEKLVAGDPETESVVQRAV